MKANNQFKKQFDASKKKSGDSISYLIVSSQRLTEQNEELAGLHYTIDNEIESLRSLKLSIENQISVNTQAISALNQITQVVE